MAVLADAVNVRENLMSVLSSGISRLSRPSYPAPLGADLALLFEAELHEIQNSEGRQLQISVTDSDDTEIVLLEGEFGWEVESPVEEFGYYAPVPVPLREIPIPGPGSYRIKIDVTGAPEVIVRFVAV